MTATNTPRGGRRRKTKAAGTLEPVQRVNLVNEAVQRLEDEILQKRFSPGDRLPPEAQLGQLLGVSRTVVREAMRILVARGLVEISQGRPAQVKAASPDDVAHMLSTFLRRGDHSLLELVEVRRPLESEIAALAARRATPEQLAVIREANDQMAVARGMVASVEADIRFHDELARATGNPIFGLLLQTLCDLMRRSRRETIARTGVKEALRGHRAVIEAVEDHDPEAARRAMLEHLTHAERDLRGAIDGAAPPASRAR